MNSTETKLKMKNIDAEKHYSYWYIFPLTKLTGARYTLYSLTIIFSQIYSIFHQKVSYHLLWKVILENWILQIRCLNFQKQMSTHKL